MEMRKSSLRVNNVTPFEALSIWKNEKWKIYVSLHKTRGSSSECSEYTTPFPLCKRTAMMWVENFHQMSLFISCFMQNVHFAREIYGMNVIFASWLRNSISFFTPHMFVLNKQWSESHTEAPLHACVCNSSEKSYAFFKLSSEAWSMACCN